MVLSLSADTVGVPDTERSLSPVIGVVLMIGIVVALGAIVGLGLLAFEDETNEPTPTASLSTEFVATDEVDPHWQLTVIHGGGDTIEADELLVRFIDQPGGSAAEIQYPERFAGNDQFRAELWGDASRASGCLVGPEPASDDQLDGFGDPDRFATGVDILLIHEPSNSVLSEETIALHEEPDRWTGADRHFLRDGVTPSINCDDEPDF